MSGGFEAVRGAITVLKVLSEGRASRQRLEGALEEAGGLRDWRSVRRWMQIMREEGFEIDRRREGYELRRAPIRLDFDGYEALATLSVLDSLAERDPAYGAHMRSAAAKLRRALPEESLRFADSGELEFEVGSASNPPEDPEVIDVLRRAARGNRKAEILYHSLRSGSTRCRVVEPVRVAHFQRAHRLFAYEREAGRVTEFRVNRIQQARPLPQKFAPEAHAHSLEEVRVRLSENAFIAYGGSVVSDEAASVERLPNGGAVVAGTTPSVFWTVREIASLGPDAEVLGGTRLKTEFLAFIRETAEKYG